MMEICPERAKMSMILDENRMMSEGWSLKKGGDGKILRLAVKRKEGKSQNKKQGLAGNKSSTAPAQEDWGEIAPAVEGLEDAEM